MAVREDCYHNGRVLAFDQSFGRQLAAPLVLLTTVVVGIIAYAIVCHAHPSLVSDRPNPLFAKIARVLKKPGTIALFCVVIAGGGFITFYLMRSAERVPTLKRQLKKDTKRVNIPAQDDFTKNFPYFKRNRELLYTDLKPNMTPCPSRCMFSTLQSSLKENEVLFLVQPYQYHLLQVTLFAITADNISLVEHWNLNTAHGTPHLYEKMNFDATGSLITETRANDTPPSEQELASSAFSFLQSRNLLQATLVAPK